MAAYAGAALVSCLRSVRDRADPVIGISRQVCLAGHRLVRDTLLHCPDGRGSFASHGGRIST